MRPTTLKTWLVIVYVFLCKGESLSTKRSRIREWRRLGKQQSFWRTHAQTCMHWARNRYLASVANPEDERVCPTPFKSVIMSTWTCFNYSCSRHAQSCNALTHIVIILVIDDNDRFAEEDTKDLTCEGIRQAILREITKYRAKERAAAPAAASTTLPAMPWFFPIAWQYRFQTRDL